MGLPATFDLSQDPLERVRELLIRTTTALELDATISVEEREGGIWASVEGGELERFIGKRGQTIDAVQLLARQIANLGAQERRSVTVDASGYRERRANALCRQAERAASDALKTGEPVELIPMPAFERRIVHTHLADRAEIDTYSVGDDPDRCVVISPLR